MRADIPFVVSEVRLPPDEQVLLGTKDGLGAEVSC